MDGDLIYHLKLKLESSLSVPFREQRLLWGQQELENGRKFRYYKLESAAILELQDKRPVATRTAQSAEEEGTETLFVKTLTG